MRCVEPIKLKLEKWSLYHVGTKERLGYAAVPCGICSNCRMNQRLIWKNRLMLEQSKHGDSCFVTLTYSDKHLPDPAHVKKSHLQKYIKRLRYSVEPIKVRYYAVGEYGDRSFRPHYHLALFGLGMINEKVIKDNWHYCDRDIGIDVGELNAKSASYLCGYVTKKVLKAESRHPVNYGKTDEFMICSKGIGKEAAYEIADLLMRNEFWKDGKILRVVKRGKKHYPLGRFLVRKCAERMGIDQRRFLIDFWANQELHYLDKGKSSKYKERTKI